MTDSDNKGNPNATTREAQLDAAMRANLRKRKAQQRARQSQATNDETTTPQPDSECRPDSDAG